MIGRYHKKEPKRKYQVRVCQRCGRKRLCTWHHVMRRRNSEEWVWLCCSREDNCHRWVHDNPKQAKKEGFYKEFDSNYRKKTSKNKWKLKKTYNIFR